MSGAALQPPPVLRIRPLRRSDWPTIEALFGANGACGGCWCMWWRVPMGGKTWEAAKGEPSRAAFKALVESGKARGLLAFAGDQPVGWCALGPRADFPRTERTKALAADWDERTWSVNCFYLPPRWRGRGVATALLDAAIAEARQRKASVLEGYPVVPAGSGRLPGAFAWTGLPSLFERAGFTAAGPRGHGKRLYRLALDTP